ncbi:MAG: hypothetical protein D6722_26005 [Bacteroidetes bacterium]|nr:MAG: hypothetical protein D6722_26005 [Bacteroidota bacterium]
MKNPVRFIIPLALLMQLGCAARETGQTSMACTSFRQMETLLDSVHFDFVHSLDLGMRLAYRDYTPFRMDSTLGDQDTCVVFGQVNFSRRLAYQGAFWQSGQRILFRPDGPDAFVLCDFSLKTGDSLFSRLSGAGDSSIYDYKMTLLAVVFDTCLHDSISIFLHKGLQETVGVQASRNIRPLDKLVFASPQRGLVGWVTGWDSPDSGHVDYFRKTNFSESYT